MAITFSQYRSVWKFKNYLQTTDHLPGHWWPAEDAVWWHGSAVQQLGAPLHGQPVQHAEQGVQAVKCRYRVFVISAVTRSWCWRRWWGTASRCRRGRARWCSEQLTPTSPTCRTINVLNVNHKKAIAGASSVIVKTLQRFISSWTSII